MPKSKALPKTKSSPRATQREGAGKTRRAILDLLKRKGPSSSAALGEALGVTPMAARLQLYELEADGLVACDARAAAPGQRGRPVKYWTLTGDADRVFPDAHQGLAVEMINSVREIFGDEGMEKLIVKHGDQQRKTYGARLASAKTVGERVKRLARARNDEGYMAEAKKDGRDWLLIENHCPICSAAKACTGLCAGELRVFSDVLGTDVKVEREEHILAGARRCAYRVAVR